MPRPDSLVVKKGSKARSRASARHAAAAVVDGDRHEAVGGRVGADLGERPSPAGAAQSSTRKRSSAAARHRIARIDRDVEQRRLELARVGHAPRTPPGGISTSMRIRWSSVRRSMSASECSIAAASTSSGCSTWRRRTRAACRSARRRGARRETRRRRAGGAAARRRQAGSSASTCRLPWITVSRLLKSWAMPPVSWPTLSSRCAWLSASSDCAALQAARQQVGERFEEAHLVVAEAARDWRERTARTPIVRPRSESGTASALAQPGLAGRRRGR